MVVCGSKWSNCGLYMIVRGGVGRGWRDEVVAGSWKVAFSYLCDRYGRLVDAISTAQLYMLCFIYFSGANENLNPNFCDF
jgi:hypothetical protein